jgi:hypothetical protein
MLLVCYVILPSDSTDLSFQKVVIEYFVFVASDDLAKYDISLSFWRYNLTI